MGGHETPSKTDSPPDVCREPGIVRVGDRMGGRPGRVDEQRPTLGRSRPRRSCRRSPTSRSRCSTAVGLQPNVAAPVILEGQRPLTFDGKPGIFYEGSEPCPYCAAERWAFIVALARFGSWSGLGIDQSAANDIDPSTQTFTFLRATYSSPYVTVRTKEILSDHQLSNGDYAPLEKPTPEETTLEPLHLGQILSGQSRIPFRSWTSAIESSCLSPASTRTCFTDSVGNRSPPI